MAEKKGYQSWTISDEFWEVVKEAILSLSRKNGQKKAANYLALLQFACAIIVWRKLIPAHKK